MTRDECSRRRFLAKTFAWSVAGAVGASLAACGGENKATNNTAGNAAAEKVCVDLDHLTSDQASLRESVEYTNNSPDAAKMCGACAFFTAEGDGACGHCQILNGPAAKTGHCTSWAAKA